MNMKTMYKAALLAALGLAGTMTVRADSGGDLLIGFTESGNNSTANDVYYDLGAVSSFTSGETWSLGSYLSAQGLSTSSVQWGVVGDLVNGGTTTTKTALTWYSDSSAPSTINGNQAWKSFQSPINSIAGTVMGETAGTGSPGTSATDNYKDQNSWYSETISPTLGSQLYNLTGGATIDVTGVASDTLWQIVDNNSAATDLGSFSLGTDGTLTYEANSAVPEPNTVIAGFGLLALCGVGALRNKASRKQA
jgi:hypothetical protein